MNDFDLELNRRLAQLKEQGLHRALRTFDSPQGARVEFQGRLLLNFSSNDYLGLANEPSLKVAAHEAVERFGTGAGASRLISGSLTPHSELEQLLAEFKGTEAALSFSTGYATALGTICALMDREDVIILDKLVHASIVDAARLSAAKLRVFAHNDMNDLANILKWADGGSRAPESSRRRSRVLIATESVFSMDGDHAPLRDLVELKEKHGAWLMVDEAHATGLYGPNRRGLAEALGVAQRIEIQMGTLGKALGVAGGYIAGSRALVDCLVNRARSFIFSTAPVPAAAAAASAGVRFAQSAEGEARRNVLWQRVGELSSSLDGASQDFQSAIIPWLIGEEEKAVQTAEALWQQGIYMPAIRFPTVARGRARLRLTVTAAHTRQDIARVADAVKRLGANLRPTSSQLPAHASAR